MSIHFELLDSEVPVELYGIFDHTCIIVPEPSTVLLAAIAGIAAVPICRRFRKQPC